MVFHSILSGGWRDQVGPAAAMDRLEARGGKLLLLSNSQSMWSGFDQHFHGYEPHVPPGYTNIRVFPGETHSLMVTGGERDYAAGQFDQGTTLFSRLTWQPSVWKRAHLCTTFAVMGTKDVYSWAEIDLVFDIQAWDNSDRGYFRASLVDRWVGTPSFDNGLPGWRLGNNAGGSTTVPNSTGTMSGENENKGGWQFARLSIDFETKGGIHDGTHPDTIGRYLELQCNNQVFDLTGLGAGQGWMDPQDPNPIGDYRGGFNPGIGAFRSTRNADRKMSILFGPTYVIVED